MTATAPAYEIVVVCYRSRGALEQLLSGLPDDLPVAVVDNLDGADGLAELVQRRPGARYEAGGGSGFACAANLGARTSAYDYLVFCNPDTRPGTSVLAALVADVAADPTCASSAANLVSAAGAVEIGVGGWEPGLRRAVVHAVGLHKLLPRAGLFARPRPSSTIAADWTSGACMAVRRETFLRLGGFDEDYFVYSEDVSFGRRVRQAGLTQRLRTDLLVEHGSAGSGAPSREMLRLRGGALSAYLHRHQRPSVAMAATGALAVGHLARAAGRLATGNRSGAGEHWAYALGVATGRAGVAGRQVYPVRHVPAGEAGTSGPRTHR